MPRPEKNLRIGLVAGEPSGDLLAAGLLTALRGAVPTLRAEGIGGPHMARAGFTSLFPMERLSFMCDLSRLAGRLAGLWQLRRRLCAHFLTHRPDVFIGVDAPEFNLGLERALRAGGLRTVHYVSPSVWAWRRYRVRKVARAVDRLLVLFPFEERYYRDTGLCVHCVGHPAVDRMRTARVSPAAARAALGLPADGRWIALLPGSRANELQRLSRPFLETAAWCRARAPDLRFIAALVSDADARAFLQERDRHCPGLPLWVFAGRTPQALCAADAALLASGTAALEALLLERPMVVAYRMSWLSHALARCLVRLRYFSLPNLLAGEALVPEFLQRGVCAERLGPPLLRWLHAPPEVARLQQRFRVIQGSLGTAADRRAADAVLELLAASPAAVATGP